MEPGVLACLLGLGCPGLGKASFLLARHTTTRLSLVTMFFLCSHFRDRDLGPNHRTCLPNSNNPVEDYFQPVSQQRNGCYRRSGRALRVF